MDLKSIEILKNEYLNIFNLRAILTLRLTED
jgi:hypothetical protein